MKKNPFAVFVLALMFFALLESLVGCKSERGDKLENMKYILRDHTELPIYEIYQNGDTVVHLQTIQSMANEIDSLDEVIRIKNAYFNFLMVDIDSIIQADCPIKR